MDKANFPIWRNERWALHASHYLPTCSLAAHLCPLAQILAPSPAGTAALRRRSAEVLFRKPCLANPNLTVDGHYETSRSYTKEEISAHNTRTDCWVIIKDKVYDVTSYVEEHPGGDAILNNAGGDSTEGFFGLKAAKSKLPSES
ncbi:hypothetical protein E2562_019534 [Oryza meyeriana var. granulata]|uniref:Cytochrome b5 heme-binding domain-containing protein n=1 Tax=Oryza meyeriana var. granulata TaxID=110450 RepID=A0A6G1CGY9_9ORYZ|nr:hypothetical protein E2562_019534 [Oryza meyeriana var. granulata]